MGDEIMKLVIKRVINEEICHYSAPDMLITSSHSKIHVQRGRETFQINFPEIGWSSIFAISRLGRRALRLDKCNVVPLTDGLVAIRRGKVFHYSNATDELTQVLSLRNCRNVLHQSVAVVDGKELFFGEYGNNSARKEVPVYRSLDGGRTWHTIFTFPAGKVKHVHGCYYDPYEKKIWTLTGDLDGECQILCSDKNFKEIEWIGDGSQVYRACNLFFEENSVHWIMDSPLQDSYHIELDRKDRTIHQGQRFPGPVWYIKRLNDGFYLAATAQEDGPGVKDEYVHLMLSEDLKEWKDICQFRHDGLPKKYFKSGVIGFPDGPQTSHSFYMFSEAIEGLDGKTVLCTID